MPRARRVLIVAYYFPPIGGIGSIRLARFASLLPGRGWDVTVLAPDQTPHALDPHLHFPEADVVRSRSIELSQVGRRVLRASRPAEPVDAKPAPAIHGILRSAAHRYLFFPDAQIGWYPGAVTAGLSALRRERYDVIYSSAYPVTAHLIARTLSRRKGMPWVAEYRDPWSDRLPDDHPYVRRAQSLERSLARDATAMVMPSPTWAKHYGELWNREIAVVPNGHDGILPERRAPRRKVLAHVGSYYPGEQDLTTIWKALARLRDRHPGDVPRIRFVGRLPDGLRAEVAASGVEDLLEAPGFLPHDEAMGELMSASMLIASGAVGDQPARRGWVPAKLFDYLASGVPVLYVAGSDTDGARLVDERPGCFVVNPGDVDGAVNAIERGLLTGDQARDTTDLSREARTSALAEILEGVCVGRGSSS